MVDCRVIDCTNPAKEKILLSVLQEGQGISRRIMMNFPVCVECKSMSKNEYDLTIKLELEK